MTVEPFDLTATPRYDLVIDRLAHWYYHPREWLKKVALMDGVYLMNNPFTFQSMEKHAAYCAMLRLGLKIPTTWLIPHTNPPDELTSLREHCVEELKLPPEDLAAMIEAAGGESSSLAESVRAGSA